LQIECLQVQLGDRARPAFPQLVVSDLARSSEWYQKTLGFADVFTMRMPDGTPMLVHLRWCLFGDLLLSPARQPIPEPRGKGITLTFAVESADDIASRAISLGAQPVEGPVDRPWNARDVAFHDPDGYRLVFTAPTAAMMERIQKGEIESMDTVVDRLRTGFVMP
jgi:catechol 2,3-dioxygenase-like lactoylglutathione lyase family enzyme